jgi:Polyketide cyclase / dehydrase and lipid transport
MSSRVVCRGSFVLPLAPSEAVGRFTPLGEREWVPDWDPSFPAGSPDDDTEPGTVFTTTAHGHTTVWVVAERNDLRVRYARMTQQLSAGTVTVECRPVQPGTEVVVTYDLTALSSRGQQVIERFAEDYRSFLESWRQSIEAAQGS